MTRSTPKADALIVATRWRRLAAELAEHADRCLAAQHIDNATHERVGTLVVREALALNVSTAWREVER